VSIIEVVSLLNSIKKKFADVLFPHNFNLFNVFNLGFFRKNKEDVNWFQLHQVLKKSIISANVPFKSSRLEEDDFFFLYFSIVAEHINLR
jgi:hypothetical protein